MVAAQVHHMFNYQGCQSCIRKIWSTTATCRQNTKLLGWCRAMCTQLDHSAIFDLSISQYGDNATTNVVALGLLIGLLNALLVQDLAVLANAGILVNNSVADFGVVTNPNGQATLVQQGLPLLVRLVVVSTHDHGILHTQHTHKQHVMQEVVVTVFVQFVCM